LPSLYGSICPVAVFLNYASACPPVARASCRQCGLYCGIASCSRAATTTRRAHTSPCRRRRWHCGRMTTTTSFWAALRPRFFQSLGLLFVRPELCDPCRLCSLLRHLQCLCFLFLLAHLGLGARGLATDSLRPPRCSLVLLRREQRFRSAFQRRAMLPLLLAYRLLLRGGGGSIQGW